MSTAGLFLLLAILAGSLAFIVWPLIVGSNTTESAFEESLLPSPRASLQAEHESILNTIRDLDFDFQTGKLIESDYQPQRSALVARGIETLMQIDGLKSELAESAITAERSRERIAPPSDRIETSIAARRRAKANEKTIL